MTQLIMTMPVNLICLSIDIGHQKIENRPVQHNLQQYQHYMLQFMMMVIAKVIVS